MASQADKIPSIFEKRTYDTRLTDDAHLYQDILRYARSVNPGFPDNAKRYCFTAWQFTG